MARVLVVEDDLASRELLESCLAIQEHEVTAVDSGEAALRHLNDVDLVILDVMLPGLSGLDVAATIERERPDLPVLMLTALAFVEHRVQGLRAGADDYLTKPFDLRELSARVEALLRRSGPPSILRAGDLLANLSQRSVTRAGEEVALTRLEFDILTVLMRNPGRVYSRNELLDLAWGDHFHGTDRTVDVRVAELRRKIGPDYVESIRGIGYRFSPQKQTAQRRP